MGSPITRGDGHILKHGAARKGRTTPEYKVWRSMIARCYYPASPSYPEYGGRGITICERWQKSFTHFLADMGPKPSLEHSIDRIDSDGNYEAENCRWATWAEQARNRKSVIWITHNGQTLCATDWELKLGLAPGLISHRLADGWTKQDALRPTRPHQRELTLGSVTRSVKEWALITGLTSQAIHDRLRRGWSIERLLSQPQRQYPIGGAS